MWFNWYLLFECLFGEKDKPKDYSEDDEINELMENYH